MHQPDGGCARPSGDGPERRGQDYRGAASISPMVDAINHPGTARPLRCCGCGRNANQSKLPDTWLIAWIWADFGSVSGVFAAALCPSCHPRIDEPAFRRRFDRTVAAMARDDIESALTGGAQ